MYVEDTLNDMLGVLGVTHVAALDGDPTAGGTELAREAITIGAAAAGQRSATDVPELAIGAGQTVRWIAYYDDPVAGNLRAHGPKGAQPRQFTADLANNTLSVVVLDYADNPVVVPHGYADDQAIVFYGAAPPTPLALNTVYFVVNGAANTFQVAAAAGGAAIDLTSAAAAGCRVSRIVPEAFGDAGTLRITDADFILR